MVFEAWGVNGTGQVIGFGTAVVVGIYHQRGYLLTPRPTAGLGPAATVSAPNAETLSAGPPVDRWVDLAWCAVLTEVEEPTESLAPAAPEPGSICLWVPVIRSPHATCAYSWISPPRRSRRTTLPAGTTTADSPSSSGGTCRKARCGRWGTVALSDHPVRLPPLHRPTTTPHRHGSSGSTPSWRALLH
jgi:hypothetical protein